MITIETTDTSEFTQGIDVLQDGEPTELIGSASFDGGEVTWELYRLGQDHAFAGGKASPSAYKAAVRTAAIHELTNGS